MLSLGFPGGSVVENLPANLPADAESNPFRWGSILGWGRSLEKKMAAYFRILEEKFYGHRSLDGCSPWGCKELDTLEQLNNNNSLSLYL